MKDYRHSYRYLFTYTRKWADGTSSNIRVELDDETLEREFAWRIRRSKSGKSLLVRGALRATVVRT